MPVARYSACEIAWHTWGTTNNGSMRGSTGCCYTAGSSGWHIPALERGHYFFVFYFQSSLVLSSSTLNRFLPSAISWAGCGHRCLPFSPQVLVFITIALRVQHSHLLYVECRFSSILLSHALALSARRFFRKKSSLGALVCAR